MPEIVSNPVTTVFERWGNAIKSTVGEGNYSMQNSSSIASDKKKYAQLIMIGNSTKSMDLEGDETSVLLAFQTEAYASGSRGLTEAYAIDEASYIAMNAMGFKRTKQTLTDNADDSIKRVTSRYQMVYTGYFLPEPETDSEESE